ncbi:MAG: phytase [bacterium]
MKRKILFAMIWGLLFCTLNLFAQTVRPSLTLKNGKVKDQDDMCIWIHPNDPAQSTIVAADKSANMLFVYNLAGNTSQSVADGFRPGNIDIRYHFPLTGQQVPIVAFNDRLKSKIIIYKIDPSTRRLERVDDGKINTVANYGFCLYRSPKTGKYYGFVTTKNGKIQQVELFENGGKISGRLVRTWALDSQTEGCVCDDETAQAYFGEETKGIWKIGAEPKDGKSPKLIAKIKDGSGLAEDVEGLTIYYAANGEGFLIASSQGVNKFTLFERKAPHQPAGNFAINGVASTDGIDVTNVPLNGNFSQGIFTYHNGKKSPYPVGIAKWEEIASSVGSGLIVDTNYWNPSKTQSTSVTTIDDLTLEDFTLLQNYPNPFNPETTIEFKLNKPAHVKLTITNILGATVRTLLDGRLNAGHYKTTWDSRDASGKQVSAGTYLYMIESENTIVTKKLTLLK